jgi:hypothetical protein
VISENTYDIIYPLAELLKEKGMVIKPYEGTFLDQAVKANHVDIPTKGIDKALLDRRSLIIKSSSTPDDVGVFHHDLTIEHVAKQIEKVAQKNLDLARNVVNPIIKEVISDTETYIDHYISHIEHDVEIKINIYDDIWDNSYFVETVKRYGTITNMDVNLYLHIPLNNAEFTIPDIVKTGNEEIDNSVFNIIKQYPESVINTLYETAFGDPSIRNKILTDCFNVNSDLKEDRDEVLILFFIAKGLYNNIPEGINASLTEYKAHMVNIISQLGNILARMIDRKRINIDRRQLIIYYPAEQIYGYKKTVIIVNEEVYGKWLSEGGIPDIILGAWVTDKERSYTELLNKKDYYIKKWLKHEQILRMTKSKDRFNNTVEGIRKAMTKQINNFDEEQLLVAKEHYHKLLNKYISYLPENFYQDIIPHTRNLVCKVLFPQSDALDILKSIDEVSNEFDEINPREAALLATIQWIGKWLAKNCQVDYLTYIEE